MKAVFNCPQCSQKLRADADKLTEEITCPSCQRVFTPQAQIQPTGETSPGKNKAADTAEKFDEKSAVCRQFSFLGACVMLGFIGLASYYKIQQETAWIGCLWLASASLGAGVVSWFASQILAIRGQLHRIQSLND